MTPLIIVKVNVVLSNKDRAALVAEIAAGIRAGALVLAGDCEIIAFDREGRLAYPIQREATP